MRYNEKATNDKVYETVSTLEKEIQNYVEDRAQDDGKALGEAMCAFYENEKQIALMISQLGSRAKTTAKKQLEIANKAWDRFMGHGDLELYIDELLDSIVVIDSKLYCHLYR